MAPRIHLRAATRALLTAVTLATFACSAPTAEDEENDPEGDTSAVVAGTPDGSQIAGRLTRAVPLESDPDPARARTYCTVRAGDVLVAKFEKRKWRVYLPDRKPCDASAPDSFRGWVPADAIEIEDAAYLGKLKRVKANAAIEVAMSYSGDKIFCDGAGERCKIREPLYGMNRCYVHPRLEGLVQNAAIALQRKKPGAKLAMLDCYRPVYVQKRMADLVSDPQWVAQPTPGRYGGHNGGIALDLSIVDERGELVDMGSGFDEFSARSNYAAGGITAAQRENRKLLRDVMVAAGLKPYDGEWWHFSLAIDAKPLDLAL